MKKKLLLPLFISSMVLALGITACGNKDNKPTPEPEDGTRQFLEASIEKRVIELDQRTKVVTEVEGVTYRSSDPEIASVSSTGSIMGKDAGMAYITVSKKGYFDRVLKVFVEDYDTVDYLVEGFEFGPAIVGVKLNFSGLVNRSALAAAQFAVKTNGSNRTVESIDLCDEEGQIIDSTESHYIRINLLTQSNMWGASGGAACFTYANNVNNWSTNIRAEVTFNAALETSDNTYSTNTKFARIAKRIVLSTREWGEAKSHTADGKTLTYKAYESDTLRKDGVLNPLVIWLHGMGEGGTDPDIALLGNDVTELSGTKIQSHFVQGKQKGAYVLAAQTPTYWMNSGGGSINGGVGHSIYTVALKSLIDNFIVENGDIDTNRIFVGGCSNGGYMTMEMAVTYGNFFKAYYPCCEAYSDSFVEDSDIQNLKNYSMWFIQAANDPTVIPQQFVLPTYNRLMEAEAKDIHLSYFTDVRGTQGNPSGNNYNGHYSWIYIFRDEVEFDQEDPFNVAAPSTKVVRDADGNAVNLFGWMAAMK